MPQIVLTTLNAKYIHAAFGLRYLKANLGELADLCVIREFDISQRPVDVAEALLELAPSVVGFGVYIWNVAEVTAVVSALKRLRPEIRVVIGGPEVSYELESQPIAKLADHVITGEADLAFGALCRQLLAPPQAFSPPRVIAAELPAPAELVLPYGLYDADDIAHRVIYVEASRGCPFTCEFCLSSLDIPVRAFPLDRLLEALADLLDRGVRQFKFVDRTFNLNLATSKSILEFFLNRYRPGLFVHFEMVPDRLPLGLREIVRRFPPGALQFEVGIQSFNPEVCERIRRRQDVSKLEDNLRFLRAETGVHIHADLIVGLPGESWESFGEGFDRLVGLRPQEIQVGLLKRLRGTPIVRHDMDWGMIYSEHPPYEILQNKLLDFAHMQRLRRFARYWDLVGNSGNFLESTPLLWSGATPFCGFMRWSDWLYGKVGRTDRIALSRLAGLVFQFLTGELRLDPAAVAKTLAADYCRAGRRDPPECVRSLLGAAPASGERPQRRALRRQARHWRENAAPLPPEGAVREE